jgi:hypothetical protein
VPSRRGKHGLAAELRRRRSGHGAQSAGQTRSGGGAQAAEVGARCLVGGANTIWRWSSGSVQAAELGGGAMASGQAGYGCGEGLAEKEIRHTHPRLEERGMDWFDRFCRPSRSHVFDEYSLFVDGFVPLYYTQTNTCWGWFNPIHVLVQNQTHATYINEHLVY